MADYIQNDEVCIIIKEKLHWASPMSKHKIFKVPRELRQVNEKAYDPYFVSIGPYHRGKDNLLAMEEYKVRFLKSLLARTNESSPQRYVAELRLRVDEARNYYAESLSMSDNDFLEMMVLDGCFIVELLHRLDGNNNSGDHIFCVDLVFSRILLDLILFENQLPLFVIWKLLGTASKNREGRYIKLFLEMFVPKLPGLTLDVEYVFDSINNVKHLLDLLHINLRPSPKVMPNDKKAQEKEKSCLPEVTSDKEKARKKEECPRIHSVTALRDAGIKFKKGEGGNLFDIKFSSGVLEIPIITVHNHTECLFRNIIVCEQFDNSFPAYLTDYMILMDRLIDTQKDVELLCGRGIIINSLGDAEAIATMFNRLGDHVSYSEDNFFYAELSRAVHKRYRSPLNRSLAKLRHDYFHNPWALISFLAAAFLLILSLLQTTFTIFPRHTGG